jgi:hypothetical protein
MREMPVPCYGCGQSVRVDRRWPEQGLLLAGWTLSGGETHCPTCALARGDRPPSPTAPPPPSGIAIADSATSTAATQYLRTALATALIGAVALAAVVLTAGVHTLAGEAQPLTVGGSFALVVLVGGLGAARRARRWQVLLAGSAWQAYRLTYVPVWRRKPGLVLAPQDESLPPLMLRLGTVFRWRSLLLKTATGRSVWVGGDPHKHAVLALHPGPRLFPAEPIRPRSLGRYRAAATRVGAGRVLTPAERYAALEKAHQKAELPIAIGWGVLGLATIFSPTTLAWLVLAAESAVWGSAVVRLRRARDRELDALDREAREVELRNGELEGDARGVTGARRGAAGLQEPVVPVRAVAQQLGSGGSVRVAEVGGDRRTGAQGT